MWGSADYIKVSRKVKLVSRVQILVNSVSLRANCLWKRHESTFLQLWVKYQRKLGSLALGGTVSIGEGKL